MAPEIANIVVIFLYCLIGLVVVRAVLSWMPLKPGNQFARFVYNATEPLMEPVRRFLPAFGGFDLSGIVVIVVLQLMVVVVRQVTNG
jgi:YggT family protein